MRENKLWTGNVCKIWESYFYALVPLANFGFLQQKRNQQIEKFSNAARVMICVD